MKVKAKDTLHVSNVQADPIRPGEVFEVSDAEGKQLIERGLATRVGPAPKAKAAPASGNKMAAAPANKIAAKPIAKPAPAPRKAPSKKAPAKS